MQQKVYRKPLVPLVAPELMSPAFKKLHDESMERLGFTRVNSLQAMAHGGELAAAARDFLSRAWSLGSLDKRLRILIRLAVSTANDCRYCTAHQIHLLVDRLKLSESLVTAITKADDDQLEGRDRAVVRFARHYAYGPGSVPDDVRRDLQELFSPQEIVEIVVIAGGMSMLNGFNDGLGVPLEDDA